MTVRDIIKQLGAPHLTRPLVSPVRPPTCPMEPIRRSQMASAHRLMIDSTAPTTSGTLAVWQIGVDCLDRQLFFLQILQLYPSSGIIKPGSRTAWSATSHAIQRIGIATPMKSYLATAVLALCASLFATRPLRASIEFAQTGDTVKLYDSAGSRGGIFKVDVLGKTSSGAAYNYGSGPYYDFFTFCVEIKESISFGTPYKVYNSNATVTINTNKTLGSFAAWLYTEFLKPVLGVGPGITAIAGWGGNLAKDANAIQYGIWKSVGWDDGPGALNGNSGRFGGALGSYDSTFLQNLLSAYAADTTWTGGASADANWNRGTEIGGVRIMNLVTLKSDGSIKHNYQDQLVWNPPPPGSQEPLPEPMSFLVWSMLAMCVGTIAMRRER
jgi:hypothetical protein